MNPAHIVEVQDYSPETLRRIIEHLEASTDFEHLVYREAELDRIWSLTLNDPRVHQAAQRAHDLVADRKPREAAAVLRGLL